MQTQSNNKQRPNKYPPVDSTNEIQMIREGLRVPMRDVDYPINQMDDVEKSKLNIFKQRFKESKAGQLRDEFLKAILSYRNPKFNIVLKVN